MARQTPFPQREKEICARLRQARESAHLTRVALARLLGIDSSRLASYEHARSPVRIKLALGLSVCTGASLPWLATGQDAPSHLYIPEGKLSEIPEKMLLSAAFDEHIKPLCDALTKHPRKLLRGAVPDEILDQKVALFGSHVGDDPDPGQVSSILSQHVTDAVFSTPPPLLNMLFDDVTFSLNKFKRNHFEAIQAHAVKQPLKKELTAVTDNSNTDGVKPEIKRLIARVNAKASKPGSKAELARMLGVAPARISEWLSGKTEPGGEVTLRLLKWVEQE